METKKNLSATQNKKVSPKKFVGFFGSVKQEFKKVEWTSKEELIGYTKIVLGGIFFFGAFIYLVDLAMRGFLGGINLFVKFITG